VWGVVTKYGRHSKQKAAETPKSVCLKKHNPALCRYTVLCTETGEKYSVDDIQCCVLKQERNREWGIYSVVY